MTKSDVKESSSNQEAQLKAMLWATRRGMLELDVILTPYLKDSFEQMSADDIKLFQSFLTQDDPDLYAWLMGFETSKEEFSGLTKTIQQYIHDKIG